MEKLPPDELHQFDDFAPGWRDAVPAHRAAHEIRRGILAHWASLVRRWASSSSKTNSRWCAARRISRSIGLRWPRSTRVERNSGTKSAIYHRKRRCRSDAHPMSTRSQIEWTEMTWNPVVGCTKVSPGCRHCYAVRMARRLKAMGCRNTPPDWVEEIYRHCRAQGVAFFFKQWGGARKSRTGRSLHGKTYDEMPAAGTLIPSAPSG